MRHLADGQRLFRVCNNKCPIFSHVLTFRKDQTKRTMFTDDDFVVIKQEAQFEQATMKQTTKTFSHVEPCLERKITPSDTPTKKSITLVEREGQEIHDQEIQSKANRTIELVKAPVLKCCFLGSAAVGKSSIIRRFVTDAFEDELVTVGTVFTKKSSLSISGKVVNLQIFDTAGQEKFDSIVPFYYSDADITVIVFDLTSRDTFVRAKLWVQTLRNTSRKEHQTILILGNKSDLGSVSPDFLREIMNYATNEMLVYYECSAKTGSNVEVSITSAIAHHLRYIQICKQETTLVIPRKQQTVRSCC